MLNTSEIGLIPTNQPKDFSHTSTPTSLVSNQPPPTLSTSLLNGNPATDLSSTCGVVIRNLPTPSVIPPDSESTTTTETALLPLPPPQRYLSQLPSSLAAGTVTSEVGVLSAPLPHTSSSLLPVSSSTNMPAQLKRKRGRPRKYTQEGGFHSQFPVFAPATTTTQSVRHSLPHNVFTKSSPSVQSPLLSPQPTTISAETIPAHQTSTLAAATTFTSAPITKALATKRARLGRPPKTAYPPQQVGEVNGSDGRGASSNDTEAAPTSQASKDASPSPPSTSPSSPPSESLVPMLTTTQSQSPPPSHPPNLGPPVRSNGSPTVTAALGGAKPAAVVTTSATSVNSRSSNPFLLERCGNIFTEKTTVTPPTLFGSSPATCPGGFCSFGGNDSNLIGRFLPQVETAVRATIAAGLPGPHAWTSQMVAEFMATVPGCQGLAPIFIENEIDGLALLYIEELHLISILKLKLGPAVKVFGAIRALREIVLSLPLKEPSTDQENVVAGSKSAPSQSSANNMSLAAKTSATTMEKMVTMNGDS